MANTKNPAADARFAIGDCANLFHVACREHGYFTVFGSAAGASGIKLTGCSGSSPLPATEGSSLTTANGSGPVGFHLW